ncbi:uncharacterized protein [Antedon mediterranea]|uniref:uncharacterized protein n=1 Tax=Antedon mediterranea TaxID=105859 RepID=UPI003AF531B4
MFEITFSRCILLVLLESIVVYCSYDRVYMAHETKDGYETCSQRFKESIGGEISGLARPYEKQLNCTVNIESPLGTMLTIEIKNVNFVTAYPSDCNFVKLLVYDGSSFETSNIVPSFPNGICNQSIPSQVIKTRSNTLSVRFEVSGNTDDVTFQAVYTSYTTLDDGNCIFCSEGICIPEELACDGLGNCADSSDENDCEPSDTNDDPKDSTTWIIIVVMAFIILLVVLIIFISVYRFRKAVKSPPTTTQEPVFYDSVVTPDYYGPSTSYSAQPPIATQSTTPNTGLTNAATLSTVSSNVAATTRPPTSTTETGATTSNATSSNAMSQSALPSTSSYVHASNDLPNSPPSYERSQQDAAERELAIKRSLSQS